MKVEILALLFVVSFASARIVKRAGCVYEGQTYQQGQKWSKQCQLDCTCMDANTGYYKCTDHCPTYDNLPNGCRMVKPPGEPCCSKPECDFHPVGGGGTGMGTPHVITGTGTGTMTGTGTGTMTGTMTGGMCRDKVQNCKDYGAKVCSDTTYAAWTKENCCAFCGGSGGTMTGGGTHTGGSTAEPFHLFGTQAPSHSGSCQDKLRNCDAYGKSICSDNKYQQWAEQNCKQFCGKCGGIVYQTQAPGGGIVINHGGTMTGGGSCVNKIQNCKDYGVNTCADHTYAQWVHENCCQYCFSQGYTMGTGGIMIHTGGTGGTIINPGGTGTGTGTGTIITHPGGTGTGTGTGTIITNPGGTGTMTMCTNKLQNCPAFGQNVCSDQQYSQWAQDNCAKYCNKCTTGGTMGGTPVINGGGTMGGTHVINGGCHDKSTGCSALNQQNHICSDATSRMYAQENCALTCNLCGGGGTQIIPGGTHTGTGGTIITQPGGTHTGTGGTIITQTGTCGDKLGNCAAYGTSVCSDSKYAAWSKDNCAKFCNLCGSMTGTGMGTGMGTGIHTGTGMGTGTGIHTGTGMGTGTGMQTSHTGTGTGTGGSQASQGCVYKGVVYHQGQSFDDDCTYKCTCDNEATGKYTCRSKCVTWQLPPNCHLNPPAAGKCCQTPNCPAGVTITYPDGYTAE